MASTPDCSVVIPMYNAQATLRESLASVFANRGLDYEVIVVNDASTDGSPEIALEFPCRLISLESNIMAANCRNLGAKHARSEIVVFFDADQLMAPDTLQKYVRALKENPEFAAVVGSLTADTPMPGFFSKFKNLIHHHTHQIADREGATLASGLTAIRKSIFEACGGFEPAFAGASIEDISLGYTLRRAGHRILFQPDIQMTHLKSYTFREMVRSDILHRSIPWTGLMLRERIWRNDLNTKGGNVVSVGASWLMMLALIGAFFMPGPGLGVGLLCFAGITVLNRDLLARARRHFGWGFTARSALSLPVMYFYYGVGLIAGVIGYLAGGSVARKRERPNTRYSVLEGSRKTTG